MVEVLNPLIGKHAAAIHEAFRDQEPLPDFLIIKDFLSRSALEHALNGCARAHLEDYAVWSESSDSSQLVSGFGPPDPECSFLTYHQRSREPLVELEDVGAALASPEVLALLSELTGERLSRLGLPHVLTSWGPGCFLGEHCDAGPSDKPAKLVIALSLTKYWERGFGGATQFAWSGSGRRVTTWPRLNQAALFRPHLGSIHWVEHIAEHAPYATRFTWTLHYE